jgi:hypothetical protein
VCVCVCVCVTVAGATATVECVHLIEEAVVVVDEEEGWKVNQRVT